MRLPGLNHRLVLELDRGRAWELLVAVLLSGILLLPLLLYVWQSSEWVRSGYGIETLKNKLERLAELNLKLKLEKASLENLERVEKIATEQIGLAQPPAGTVVLVDVRSLRPARQAGTGRLAAASGGAGREHLENDAADQRSH